MSCMPPARSHSWVREQEWFQHTCNDLQAASMPVVSGSLKILHGGMKLLGLEEGSILLEKCQPTSHLQKETQRPRPRDCQVLFAEHPSQTFYEIGITPKPEKFLGSAYILKRMSNKSWHSPRDCLQSEEPACSLLLAARALPDGRIPSCHKQKEQEARPLHLSCSWCCHRALQMGAQKYAKFSPNFSSCYVAQSAILPV